MTRPDIEPPIYRVWGRRSNNLATRSCEMREEVMRIYGPLEKRWSRSNVVAVVFLWLFFCFFQYKQAQIEWRWKLTNVWFHSILKVEENTSAFLWRMWLAEVKSVQMTHFPAQTLGILMKYSYIYFLSGKERKISIYLLIPTRWECHFYLFRQSGHKVPGTQLNQNVIRPYE